MKKILPLLALAGTLLVVSSCGESQPAAESQADAESQEPHAEEIAKFRVEVSRDGFDSTEGPFELDVEQGQEVEITFVYGDGDFVQNNPHVIVIPEYGIETAIIDENNPEETVRFTVTGTGSISFKCANMVCIGHPKLQGGRIVPHTH